MSFSQTGTSLRHTEGESERGRERGRERRRERGEEGVREGGREWEKGDLAHWLCHQAESQSVALGPGLGPGRDRLCMCVCLPCSCMPAIGRYGGVRQSGLGLRDQTREPDSLSLSGPASS